MVLDNLGIHVAGDQTGKIEDDLFIAEMSDTSKDEKDNWGVTFRRRVTSLHESNVGDETITLPVVFVEKFIEEFKKHEEIFNRKWSERK